MEFESKKLTDYIQNEVNKLKSDKILNENTAQLGMTDTFAGSKNCGPHHHEYVIWNEFGYGYTSDAIAEPNCGVAQGGHTHHIIDGKVWPAGDGHTHELLNPMQTDTDTKIGNCKCHDGSQIQPQVLPMTLRI